MLSWWLEPIDKRIIMKKFLCILIVLVWLNASAQTSFLPNVTWTGYYNGVPVAVRVSDIMMTAQTWLKPGTDSIFAIRLYQNVSGGTDTLKFFRYRIPATNWADIPGKPSTFTAAAHTHQWSEITNQPSIPSAQVQSDWNALSGMGVVLNKPTIPAAQVQSDWNSVSGLGVILNKPIIPVVLTTSLTGYSSGAGTLSASDNILQGFNKLNGNITATTTTANNAMPKSGGTFTGKITVTTIGQTRRAIADANATIASTDYLIAFTSISAARTVTLPAASSVSGQFFIIKDESGSASLVNTISIVGTVDAASNPVVITIGRGLYRIYSNGTSWFAW